MRFFTTDDLDTRIIPAKENFVEVISGLRIGFEDVYRVQRLEERTGFVEIAGAIVIGSIARGSDVRRTSDIDVLVFYDDRRSSADQFLAYLRVYRHFWINQAAKARRYNIPTNIYTILYSQLFMGDLRRNNRQFLGHAVRSLHGLPEHTGEPALLCGSKERIIEMYEKSPKLTQQEADQYITGKLRKLLDAYASFGSMDDQTHVHNLANAANAPFHGARQIFDVLGIKYVDSKKGVIDAIGEQKWSDVSTGIREVDKICKEYEKNLERFAKNQVNPYPIIDGDRLIHRAIDALRALKKKIV
jgi:hypothetical protein